MVKCFCIEEIVTRIQDQHRAWIFVVTGRDVVLEQTCIII
jgi:hypothetical protein